LNELIKKALTNRIGGERQIPRCYFAQGVCAPRTKQQQVPSWSTFSSRGSLEFLSYRFSNVREFSWNFSSLAGAWQIRQIVIAELLQSMTCVDSRHLIYKGASAAMPDLQGARVTMMFRPIPAGLPPAREGMGLAGWQFAV
jgi:hypothetical protein